LSQPSARREPPFHFQIDRKLGEIRREAAGSAVTAKAKQQHIVLIWKWKWKWKWNQPWPTKIAPASLGADEFAKRNMPHQAHTVQEITP
jgi:hypothetical protein